MKLRLLGMAAMAALAATGAQASTSMGWAPQIVDTGVPNDFDDATQTFAGVAASNITFSGDGYFHNHGNGDGFSIKLVVNGVSQTIYSIDPNSDLDGFFLSDLGTINFAGGTVTELTLGSQSYVGEAFHGFFSESFTLDGDVPAVPEPASWALMIGGLGLVGSVMRRRATKVSFA